MTNIHYFYDPMCGWCYGATSLIQLIDENSSLNLIFHPGGMIEKSTIPDSFKQHILEADPRIAALTDAIFGEGYINRLQSSAEFILDSFLPIKAILVGQTMGINSLAMLKAIQSAHYQQGLEVHQLSELCRIAKQFNINEEEWLAKMHSSDDLLTAELDNSHQLMQQLNVSGYPTLIAEINGSLTKLPHEQYYGRPQDWKQYLASL